MRKESIGRLLLSLLTAFVMVAGVFGAAVQMASEQLEEGSNQPISKIAGELETGTRETGDAPVSAMDSITSALNSEIPTELTISTGENGLDVPQVMQQDIAFPDGEVPPKAQSLYNMVSSEHGTRAITVDANGPYGEQPPNGTPYKEGETVPFSADIIGGNNDDYQFRWDVNGDEVFDGPGTSPDFWGAYGENTYDHEYKDNYVKEALVQAWDGVSMTTVFGEGRPLDEAGYSTYWSWVYAWTVGWQFEVNEDVIVDELGVYCNYYPYHIYNIRLWDDGGSLIYSLNNPGQRFYSWRWFSIPDTPLNIGTYRISIAFYGYLMPATNNPGLTDDGIIQVNRMVYASGNSFPSILYSTSPVPTIDFHYKYSYQIPDVTEGLADVFVDNVAPVVGGAKAIGEPGKEGSEIGVTASFLDPGTDDTWMYRANWGDGTYSDWYSVDKASGGASVLFVHTWEASINEIRGLLEDELGVYPGDPNGYLTKVDAWAFRTQGVPDLAFMLGFNTVIVGTNYGPIPQEAMGDRLAEYSERGGNVITMWLCEGSEIWGMTGRWMDEDFNILTPTGREFATVSMGTVYDPSHPIMDGVSTITTTLRQASDEVEDGAVRLADFTNDYVLAGYRNEGHHGAKSGRIVGINMFPRPAYSSGDYMRLLGNAVKWACQAGPPQQLPMPIELRPIYHIYVDDHPEHVTSEDVFDVIVEVRDDDHGKVVGGAGPDWDGENLALAPKATATHSGGGVGVWGPDRLNNGDKVGLYNDCWTAYGGGVNWNQLVWPNPVTIGGTKSYYTRYRTLNGYCMHSCDIQWWDGSNWVTDQHYDDNDHGNHWIDAVIPLTAPVTTTRLRMSNMLTYTTNGNIMIQEWEVFGILPGGDPYEMDGLGEDSTTALIENVKPGIFVPDTIVKVADENSVLTYEGIEITDAALMEPTEEFWYRWNFDDGLGPGPWIYKGTMSPPPIKILLLHTWGSEGSSCIAGFQSELETRGFKYYTLDDYNWGPTGTNINPTLAFMQDYDVIVVSINYYIFDQAKLDDMGNKLADYSDGGGGVIQMTFASGSLWYSNIAGRWSAEDYNPIRYAANHYGYVTMGDVYDPTHPIMDEVSDVNCYYKHGSSRETAGATRLVDYSNGMVLCAYTNENYHTPGGGRIAGVNFFPWPQYSGGDAMRLAMNSVVWAWGKEIPTPVIPTVYKTYKDNGIYDVDLQVIDDDMGWDWIIGGGSAQPTPAPGQVPTISNNHMIVEVLNTDPVISPRIRAYVELDLSLRMSGNKHNTATMRLIENGNKIGEVTVYRDPGSPDIGVLSGTLEMTKDYDYKLEIEYDPDDLAGANPTWIFSAHWPDGKFKELKHTFNSNDPSDRVWTIDNLKSMMLGHDIIFEAEASDDGSDDLAFVWNFGDSTPFGVHVYANADPDVYSGVSDEATVIFDQDPDREPWFDRGLNDVRSPFGTSISVKDSISHVFDEGQPYYYYVTLTVMDDDVCDGYPSTFNNDGGYDMEFIEINLG